MVDGVMEEQMLGKRELNFVAALGGVLEQWPE